MTDGRTDERTDGWTDHTMDTSVSYKLMAAETFQVLVTPSSNNQIVVIQNPSLTFIQPTYYTLVIARRSFFFHRELI